MFEEGPYIGIFHDFSAVHDGYFIAGFRDDAQIMRDKIIDICASAAAPSSAPEFEPEWSRQAPWSARLQ